MYPSCVSDNILLGITQTCREERDTLRRKVQDEVELREAQKVLLIIERECLPAGVLFLPACAFFRENWRRAGLKLEIHCQK